MDDKEEIIGKIIKIKGERAIVEVLKEDGWEKTGKTLDVNDPLKTKIGWVVRIKWKETGKITDNALLVLPTLASMLAGALFGYHMAQRVKVPTEWGLLAGTVLWGLFGLSYSYKYWRDTYGRGLQPTVEDVLKR
jgi:hypothetical protein